MKRTTVKVNEAMLGLGEGQVHQTKKSKILLSFQKWRGNLIWPLIWLFFSLWKAKCWSGWKPRPLVFWLKANEFHQLQQYFFELTVLQHKKTIKCLILTINSSFTDTSWAPLFSRHFAFPQSWMQSYWQCVRKEDRMLGRKQEKEI